MDFINFNIRKWFALCPGAEMIKHWETLAEKESICLGVSDETPVDLIPPMMRRRMSSLSKLALQTAAQLSVDDDIDYIVFASRHGELTRTVKLLEDIIGGGDASPILFSQSVHNTAAGLFTIACKQAKSVCSLAAGENTLHSAFIEASCYLQENPLDTVLVVNFDEALPEPYQQYEKQQYQGFALGFLLESGEEFKVTALKQFQENENPLPQAFSCIDYLINKTKSTVILGQKNSWHWEKTNEH